MNESIAIWYFKILFYLLIDLEYFRFQNWNFFDRHNVDTLISNLLNVHISEVWLFKIRTAVMMFPDFDCQCHFSQVKITKNKQKKVSGVEISTMK